MEYYHIKLSPIAKHLCTIVILWGYYEYQKLPMEIWKIPDNFQVNISELYEGFNVACSSIDYLIIITKKYFVEHLKSLDTVLQELA